MLRARDVQWRERAGTGSGNCRDRDPATQPYGHTNPCAYCDAHVHTHRHRDVNGDADRDPNSDSNA